MDKKIKIMQISHDLGIGGLPRVVTDICLNIDKSKFDISVCCLRGRGEYAKELERNNIKVYCISENKKNKIDYMSTFKLYNFLRRKNIDIIHTHNTQPLIDGTISGKMIGTPIIIHTDHARDFPDKRKYMFAEKILSFFIDKIVAVSEATKQKLIHFERIKEEKITVIWNGINPDKFTNKISPAWKKKQLEVDDRYPILGLGVRLSKQKGITYLLNAMPKIIKEYPKVVLLIAGYGEEENALKQEVSKLGIEYYARFLGPRLDMHEILTVLDIYVLPSVWEGMPLVILEAMAAGKPIVATSVDGTKEVIVNGESGLLVPSKDCNALAEAILYILGNPDFKTYLSENARKRFQNYFTVQNMVKNYENLYQYFYKKKIEKKYEG